MKLPKSPRVLARSLGGVGKNHMMKKMKDLKEVEK